MKKLISILLVVIVTVSLTNMGCTPEIIDDPNSTFSPPLQIQQYQNVLIDANMNITIESPMNFAILNGRVTGPGGNEVKVKWEKITGPVSYLLVSPDSLKTKVTNLEKGVYTFKLSATNSGQTITDTMTLIVQDPTSSNKKIFFWSLNWSCPFGCGIYLGEALSYLPANSPFNLYLRREFSSVWELVVPDSSSSTARFYYASDDQIMVYDTSNMESSDHPEIKIVF